MTNILQNIFTHKRKEVEERKSLYPEKLLERSIYFNTEPLSLKKYLLRSDLSGIIAEFKRRSPSRGGINPYADPETVTIGYMQGGASALSVLTDDTFFGGNNSDLMTARKFNFCPILRKDFILDRYQVIEAKSIGADAVLLIAAMLDKAEVVQLSDLAHSLGMEVLLELHDREELDKIPNEKVLIGVNNRNLKSMQTQVKTAFDMLPYLPAETVKVAESGISNPQTIRELKAIGYQGFLIGEHFMSHHRPPLACRKMVQALKTTQQP